MFFIETVHKNYFVLRANGAKQELIDLNRPSKLSKILTSVTGLWSSMIDEKQNPNNLISNLLLKSPTDHESFKTITVKDYELETRFVNIPLNPGDKCKPETYPISYENL